MKGGYFLFNGQFHKEGDAVFTLADLSQRAGGFSDYFRAEHNEILFPRAISAHLIATAETKGLAPGGLTDPEGRLLRRDVSRLLNKNKLYLAARIGIQVYPSEEKINIILTAHEMERGYYPLKEPGLLLSFASVSLWGSCACIEKDQVFFTTESSDRHRCAIREEVMKSVKEAGFEPLEIENMTPEMLLKADEMFLYDACNGVQKVLGLEERRYFSPKTRLIAEKLTERAKKGR